MTLTNVHRDLDALTMTVTASWRVLAVEAPHSLQVEDGFADEDGQPVAEMPTMHMRVDLTEQAADGTSVVIVTTFPSREAMEQLASMGMDEGLRAAMGQMDALLAA